MYVGSACWIVHYADYSNTSRSEESLLFHGAVSKCKALNISNRLEQSHEIVSTDLRSGQNHGQQMIIGSMVTLLLYVENSFTGIFHLVNNNILVLDNSFYDTLTRVLPILPPEKIFSNAAGNDWIPSWMHSVILIFPRR